MIADPFTLDTIYTQKDKSQPGGVSSVARIRPGGNLASVLVLTLRLMDYQMSSKDDKKPPRFSDPERARTVPLKHSATPSDEVPDREVDLFEDDRPTEEISSVSKDQLDNMDIQTEERSLELQLPSVAEEEFGLIDATAPATIPEMMPPPQAVAAAFEKAESRDPPPSSLVLDDQTNPSVSEEVVPVHVYVPDGQTGTDSNADALAPNNPLRDTGVKPLDISQFEAGQQPPPKQDKLKIIRVESPDQAKLKMRKGSRIGFRDVILILLIILLGIAIYITWVVYQDYKTSNPGNPPPAETSSESNQ